MISVRVPATTANLGPGFDVLGLALNLYNYVEMKTNAQGLTIEIIGEGEDLIPINEENIVFRAAKKVWEKCQFRYDGIYIKLKNNIPLARGLGSSAAAITGGMVAANALAGYPLSNQEILQLATEFEGHPDNVAPALLGGLIISNFENGKVHTHQIEVHDRLQIVAIVPDFQLSTKLGRELLPQFVTIEDASFNISRVSFLITAFLTGNFKLLNLGMEDRLHQPYRSELIPGMEKAFLNAKKAGAYGVALSGSGPTLIAFCPDNIQFEQISSSMARAFREHNISISIMNLLPDNYGARVINGGF